MGQDRKTPQRGGFLGTLKDALAAASRDETGKPSAQEDELEAVNERPSEPIQLPPPLPAAEPAPKPAEAASEPAAKEAKAKAEDPPPAEPKTRGMSAAAAALEARGGVPVSQRAPQVENVEEPTGVKKVMVSKSEDPARTRLVRGKVQVDRGNFDCDPVVGWLVVVGGLGIGAFRPIYEGNNSIGRALTQRIPIDFGDDAISAEEQAYIRYDSNDRSFLFVPNLSKTNIVTVNNARPTGAVDLNAMDVIVMGRTQLVFVPFCGPDFDWSEISDK